MVPRDAVYQTRIELSGQGLPASSEGGYSLLDDQGISTSEFQEQTDFKRAMEGELASTIEAIDGVNGAVVHLAMPAKDVFADEQQPPTASVLVQTSPGRTLTPEQVQAVVHLVASSIDGLDPDDVTVAVRSIQRAEELLFRADRVAAHFKVGAPSLVSAGHHQPPSS